MMVVWLVQGDHLHDVEHEFTGCHLQQRQTRVILHAVLKPVAAAAAAAAAAAEHAAETRCQRPFLAPTNELEHQLCVRDIDKLAGLQREAAVASAARVKVCGGDGSVELQKVLEVCLLRWR
jgi:hypothetical protein